MRLLLQDIQRLFLEGWGANQADQFRIEDRRRRAPYVRMGLGFACLTALGYLFTLLISMPDIIASEFTVFSLIFILYCAIYWQITKLDLWIKYQFLDFLFLVFAIYFVDKMRSIIVKTAEITGWDAIQTATANSSIMVIFVSVIFASSFRYFILWCVICVTVYLYNINESNEVWSSEITSYRVFVPILLISLWIRYSMDRTARRLFDVNIALEKEKFRTEQLLYNVLPQEVAERIRAGITIADPYSDASVVFVDLVGSSALARSLSPKHFVEILNRIFSMADKCAAVHNVEKVKTIGDAYLAVAGAAVVTSRHAGVDFAKSLIVEIRALAEELQLDLHVRVGIHNGPVIGGVIGETRMAYDYWGDTMNIASRLQTCAEPDGICVTEQTYYATRDAHIYAPARLVVLKGLGETKVFYAVI